MSADPAPAFVPQRWKRVGMLTPSSNSVLEPYTSAMFGCLGANASVHFSRFAVTEISLSAGSQAQFDETPILQAARLLADAKVDAIAWNGTSAGWLGFKRDEALCARISKETGIASSSSMLALNEVLRLGHIRKLGLVTPYLPEIQQRIVANYQALGLDVVAEAHLGDRGNFSFAEYPEAQIAAMIREVAAAKPDAIAIICTNFRGAPLAAALEAELGCLILDSVSLTAWKTMRMAGLDTRRVTGWGRLFGTFAAPA